MTPNPTMTDEQQVLAVEDEWVEAEAKRDESVLRRVVDDRFVLNSSKGKTSNKDEMIAAVLAWNLVSQDLTERTVLVEGDIGVVCGTAALHFPPNDQANTTTVMRYLAIYIKRTEGWRALALHMSPHAS